MSTNHVDTFVRGLLKSCGGDDEAAGEAIKTMSELDAEDMAEEDMSLLEANLNLIMPQLISQVKLEPGQTLHCLIVLVDVCPLVVKWFLVCNGFDAVLDCLKTSDEKVLFYTVVAMCQITKIGVDYDEGEKLMSGLTEPVMLRMFALLAAEHEDIFWAVVKYMFCVGPLHKLYGEGRNPVVATYIADANGKLLVEGLLRLINRSDDATRLEAITLVVVLLRDQEAAALFYTNDLNVLSDVIMREISDTVGATAVLSKLLEALAYAIDHTQYLTNCSAHLPDVQHALSTLAPDHPCHETAKWLIMALGANNK